MRLIDADEFLRTTKMAFSLFSLRTNNNGKKILKTIYELIQAGIDETPTIEAEPIKHGHWEVIKCNTILDRAVFSKALKCSECGKWKFGNVLLTQRFYYCPNCGAKMDIKFKE